MMLGELSLGEGDICYELVKYLVTIRVEEEADVAHNLTRCFIAILRHQALGDKDVRIGLAPRRGDLLLGCFEVTPRVLRLSFAVSVVFN